jgi:hypothetical protein
LKGLRKMCIPGRGGYLKLKGKVNIWRVDYKGMLITD